MSRLRDYAESLRPAQWIKNSFILLPLLFGKSLLVPAIFFRSFAGVCVFCAASSAVYLMNDLADRGKDRFHPSKKLRPVAAGKIPVPAAVRMGALLSAAAFAGGVFLGPDFLLVLTAYAVFNLVYTCVLKHWVIVDVFCIAVFFLLRIYAGSILGEVSLSPWIVIMTGLLALFLGFNKRRQELELLKGEAGSHRPVLSKYSTAFIDQMIGVITASIVIAYSLYTVDSRTVAIFGTRHMIFTIPFVYYGIFRYLYLIHASRCDGDPTRIVLKDLPTQINLLLWVLTSALVIYKGL